MFGLSLRQTVGFVESLFCLAGLDWAVPDYSTLSRRQGQLTVVIPARASASGLALLVDSTGVKVSGEVVSYKVHKGSIQERSFKTVDGWKVTASELERLEMLGSD